MLGLGAIELGFGVQGVPEAPNPTTKYIGDPARSVSTCPMSSVPRRSSAQPGALSETDFKIADSPQIEARG